MGMDGRIPLPSSDAPGWVGGMRVLLDEDVDSYSEEGGFSSAQGCRHPERVEELR